MKRNNITLIVCIISSIFILIFDFVKFDLIIKVKGGYSFGTNIVVGFLIWIPYILYGILAIWAVRYIFKKSRINWWKTLLPMGIMIITILLLVLFPYTKAYLSLNYSLNKESFQKTVQLMYNGEIQQYQIGTDKYMVPFRLTSYSDVLYTDVHDGVTKIMFYAFSGLKKDVVIVYCSDDSGIDKKDFSGSIYGGTWNFSNIKKIDVNWYSAKVDGKEVNAQNDNNSTNNEIKKSDFNIDDLTFLRLGMTISEVEKAFGKPDFQTGSGFLKDAYKLDDESYIELNYGPGQDALRSANIKYKDGTTESIK